MKILIVEDDHTLRGELSTLLRSAGYEPESVTDFTRTLDCMCQADADLILLDITLPGMDGEALLREYRRSADTPVIMLTSRTSEVDEVLSMSAGADDYVSKPYRPAVLLLRISAVLKRASGTGEVLRYRDAELSPTRGSLIRAGQEVVLTKNEMIVFRTLLARRGEIVSRDELMTALWDNDEYVNDNALTVNVSRLRSKLADFGWPDAVETRKKQGYVLL